MPYTEWEGHNSSQVNCQQSSEKNPSNFLEPSDFFVVSKLYLVKNAEMYTEKNCVKNIGMFLKDAYLLCTAFVLTQTAQILHEAEAYSEP